MILATVFTVAQFVAQLRAQGFSVEEPKEASRALTEADVVAITRPLGLNIMTTRPRDLVDREAAGQLVGLLKHEPSPRSENGHGQKRDIRSRAWSPSSSTRRA